MKNRRSIIVALLLVAALALGIGYAVTTGHLIVNGTVSTQQQTFEVKFTSWDNVTASNNGITAVVGALPDKTTSLTINGMSKQNDTVTGTFTITNSNEFTMYVTDVTIDNAAGNYFSVSTSWDNMTEAVAIPAGQTTTIDITVTLNQGMSDQIKQFFTITLDATAINPNGSAAPEETTAAVE